jgi:hypothetical protein
VDLQEIEVVVQELQIQAEVVEDQVPHLLQEIDVEVLEDQA